MASASDLRPAAAVAVRVRGVVQGVGFRPFVLRLAREAGLAGWVRNAGDGVEIRIEGPDPALRAFVRDLSARAPAAAAIAAVDVEPREPVGAREFAILESRLEGRPTTRISPDLAVCARCVHELFDPLDPRVGYPYINCTECGPRYSIILRLPYDRPATTMLDWPMDEACAREYHDPESRRFHAQPVACPRCGPHYRLLQADGAVEESNVVDAAAGILAAGRILAVKGIGGYHLACDARNVAAVRALRERKFRKEKPFALMVPDLEAARRLVHLTAETDDLLESPARPIVLAPAIATLPEVAPDNGDLGIMLPYTPLHFLLFRAGAPEVLVMTSANRSSEPIAYVDDDALEGLRGIADAFLVGERPIARRVEDSIVRDGPGGPVILRRSRGYAPGAVAAFPAAPPILALGADLKNAVTLVVDGQAFVSQHIGDLDQFPALRAFHETIEDLLRMYDIPRNELLVVHDAHPEYRSSLHAPTIGGGEVRSVQHHRAHVASVLAERGAWDARVVGIALDGTGYGDDGAIWGGEIFVGGVLGMERVAHLRTAALVGGDAAARHPIQAAVGFLTQIHDLPNPMDAPFQFPERYREARRLLEGRTRVFPTTSVGRLFDAAAALLGFTRPITFEGQAAIWLEQVARGSAGTEAYPFPLHGDELDFRPLLRAVAIDRVQGRDPVHIARAFHAGLARGLADTAAALARSHGLDTVVASGGVLQNRLLVEDLAAMLEDTGLALWTNHAVPPNDGGVSLGQAALAAVPVKGRRDA